MTRSTKFASILIVAIVLTNISGIAQTNSHSVPNSAPIVGVQEPIATDFPVETATLNDAAAKADNLAAAAAAVDLVRKANARAEVMGDAHSGTALRAAWRSALALRASSADSSVRTTIENEWAIGMQNEKTAKWQVAALADRWDRSITVYGFWKLFNTTSDVEILKVACLGLYLHGGPQEIEMLDPRLQQTKDPQLLAILRTTHDWMKYELVGRRRGQQPPTTPQPGSW